MSRHHIPVPAHAHRLVRLFVAEVNRQPKTVTATAIARRAGVDMSTFWSWRSQHNPILPSIEAALNAVDVDLCIRRRKTGEVITLDGTVVQP
jgi:hypothetical protein